jgi:hypothetical protein
MNSPELTVICWRDIPAQVTATDGKRSARVQLTERFQRAIDAAAMKAGLVGSEQYLDEWRRDTRSCGEDLEAEATAEADRLEALHTPERVRALIRSGGRRPSEDPPQGPA